MIWKIDYRIAPDDRTSCPRLARQQAEDDLQR